MSFSAKSFYVSQSLLDTPSLDGKIHERYQKASRNATNGFFHEVCDSQAKEINLFFDPVGLLHAVFTPNIALEKASLIEQWEDAAPEQKYANYRPSSFVHSGYLQVLANGALNARTVRREEYLEKLGNSGNCLPTLRLQCLTH